MSAPGDRPPPVRPFFAAGDAAGRLRRLARNAIFVMICRGDLAGTPPGRARRVVLKVLLSHIGHHPNGNTAWLRDRSPRRRRPCPPASPGQP